MVTALSPMPFAFYSQRLPYEASPHLVCLV